MSSEDRAEGLLRAATAELRSLLPKSAAQSESVASRPTLWTTRERFWPMPIYVQSAHGAYLEDIDGREYIDCNMGHGPLILGHCHPAVVRAVEEQLTKGNHYGPPSVHEAELAEIIVRWVPGAERVAFTNSGSEGAMAAARIAFAATGRQKIAKFEGGLHGSYEPLRHSVLSYAGSRSRPTASPDYAGMPGAVSDTVVMLPFNDDQAFDLIRAEGDQLACVFAEPLQGSAGSLLASVEFLRKLRSVCDEIGAILVFDEVITGFRMGPSSGAGTFGVTADLTVLGKAIGGGLPVGAVCGRGDLIDLTASTPDRPASDAVFIGGTFSGNPLTAVAGSAQLTELVDHQEGYERLDLLGTQMREGLLKVLADLGLPGFVTGAGSIWGGPYFTSEVPRTMRDIAEGDNLAAKILSTYLLCDGVLVTSPSHLNFVSTVHTEADVDRVIAAHKRALTRLQAEGGLREAERL